PINSKSVADQLPSWVNTALAIKKARPRSAKARAEFMTELTDEVWRFMAPELTRMNLVKEIDKPNLAIYCRAFAEYMSAIIDLDRDGMTYSTTSPHSGKIHRLHPATRMRKEALQTMKEIGEVIGITPMARQRLFQFMADAARGQLPLNDETPQDDPAPGASTGPVGLLDPSRLN
ncbi:MAG: phage terminase small subunit P27 family, partial [Pseudomonadota bacterium]